MKTTKPLVLLVLMIVIAACALGIVACQDYNPDKDLPGIKTNAVMEIEKNMLTFAQGMTIDKAEIVEKSNCIVANEDDNTEVKVTAENVRKGIVTCEDFDLNTAGTKRQVKVSYKKSAAYITYDVVEYSVNFYLDDNQTLWTPSGIKTLANGSLNDDLELSVWVNMSDYNYSVNETARRDDADRAARFNGWYDADGNLITGVFSYTALKGGKTLNVKAGFMSEEEYAVMGIRYDDRNRREFYSYSGDAKVLNIPEGVTYVNIAQVFAKAPCSFEQINIPSTATLNLPLTSMINTTGLTKITVDKNNPTYADYENALYSKDYTKLYLMPASSSSVSFSDKVTSFENFACCYWKIEEVALPQGLKSVGSYCFAFAEISHVDGMGRQGLIEGTNAYFGANIDTVSEGFGNYMVIGEGKYILSSVDADAVTFTVKPETTSVSGQAFSGCTQLVSADLSNSQVESIGNSAFSNCAALKTVKLPSTLKYMGSNVFYDCKSLEKVEGFTSVTFVDDKESKENTVPDATFRGCEKLSSITLPNSIKEIGDDAFYNCVSLVTLNLPSSLETIGENAFFSCGFETITLPKTLKKLGNSAFYGSELTSIDLSPCEELTALSDRCFQQTKLQTVTIPDRITAIPDYCFYRNESLTSVKLSKVTVLGEYSFGYCTQLTDFDFGSVLVTIKMRAFTNCHKLDNVVLPNTVKEVLTFAFQRCDGLQHITLGAGVEDFGTYTMLDDKVSFNAVNLPLWQCYNVKYIDVDAANPNFTSVNGVLYGKSVAGCFENFDSKTSVLYSVPAAYDGNEITLPADVKVILPYAFQSQKNIKTVGLNEGLENIGKATFYMSTSVETVTIPSTVTTIGIGIFSNCTSIKNFSVHPDNARYKEDNGILYDGTTLTLVVKLNNSVVSINDGTETISSGAFMSNEIIEQLILPDSVKSVESKAFKDCPNLRTITIGKGLESIAGDTFASLPSLAFIRVDSDNANFKSHNDILYSADGSKLLLCAAKNGITDLDDVCLENSDGSKIALKEIGAYAFSHHATLESARLPAGVLTVGEYGFYECFGLKEFYSSKTLTSIGQYAFSFATMLNPSDQTDTRASDTLKTVLLYGDLKSIGDYAFHKQYGIENVYLHMTETESDALLEANKSSKNTSYLFDGCPVVGQTGQYYNNNGQGVNLYLYMETETLLPAPDGYEWFYVDGDGNPQAW